MIKLLYSGVKDQIASISWCSTRAEVIGSCFNVFGQIIYYYIHMFTLQWFDLICMILTLQKKFFSFSVSCGEILITDIVLIAHQIL